MYMALEHSQTRRHRISTPNQSKAYHSMKIYCIPGMYVRVGNKCVSPILDLDNEINTAINIGQQSSM